MDWEEFLTIMGLMVGSFIMVNTDDPDGTDFNQLRDAVDMMRVRPDGQSMDAGMD